MLRGRLDDLVSDGAGGVVVVTGEAGVGKSTLVAELSVAANDRPVGLLVGRCIQFGESILPAAAVVDLLRGLEDQLEPDQLESVLGPAGRDLAGLIPSWRDGDQSVRDLDGNRLVELVYAAITRFSRLLPVVLIVEDVHWADRTTRDLVGVLALTLSEEPVLLVVTCRSEALNRRHPALQMAAELQHAHGAVRLDLEPFDVSTTADFVASTSSRRFEPEEIADLQRRSGGNAFYLRELLAASEHDTVVPTTLRDLILSQSIDLDDDTLSLLRTASIAGSTVDADLLSRVTGLGEKQLSSALRNLVSAGLLVERADRLEFRHDLTREVFAEELLAHERAALHSEIAEALQRDWPDRVGEIAYHWYESGNQQEALAASVTAGLVADRTGATAEALLHYERSLGLWDRVGKSTTPATEIGHAELLMRAAETADLMQEFDRSVELGRRACDEYAATDALSHALALSLYSKLLWTAGAPGLHEVVDQAMQLIEHEQPSFWVARVLASAGRNDYLAGREELALERGRRAAEIAEVEGDSKTVASAMNTTACARYALGDPTAIAELRSSLALAHRIDDPDEATRCYINLVEMLCMEGQYPDALELALDGLDYVEVHGYRSTAGASVAENVSRCMEALGMWEEIDALTEKVQIWRHLDLDVPAPTSLAIAARVMVRRGQTESARPILEHDLEVAFSDYYEGDLHVVLTGLLELRLLDGASGSDPHLVGVAVERLSQSELLEVLAAALRCDADAAIAAGYRGDEAARAAHRSAASATFAHVDAVGNQPRSSASPESQRLEAQCRAEYLRAQGEHDATAWNEIATQWEELGRPWPTAYAKWRMAEAMMLDSSSEPGSRDAARQALQEAHKIALLLGAEPLRADIETLARRGRIDLVEESKTPPESPKEPAPFDLTDRELEVLALVALGYSNGRIGEELFISTKTASVHVSNILRKLAAANRIEAAAIAHEADLVPHP